MYNKKYVLEIHLEGFMLHVKEKQELNSYY